MKLPQGFTLVELLVSLTVMSIIAVFSFVNLRSLREDHDLKQLVEDVQGNLRLAQTNSVSSVNCDTPTQKWIYEQGSDYSKIYCAEVEVTDENNIKTLNIQGRKQEKSYMFKEGYKTSKVYSSSSDSCQNDGLSATYLIFDKLSGKIDRWFGTTRTQVCEDQKHVIFEITRENPPEEFKCIGINQSGLIQEIIWKSESRCYQNSI